MAKLNFQEALNTKVGDIERPPQIPQGTYLTVVAKPPTFDKVGQDGQYETCDFTMKFLSATDEVDEDELKAYGDITSSSLRLRFMFNTEDETRFKQSEFNLRRFLEDTLGIDKASDKSLKQCLAESVNHQCLSVVSWRPDRDDPEVMHAEIKRTAPVE